MTAGLGDLMREAAELRAEQERLARMFVSKLARIGAVLSSRKEGKAYAEAQAALDAIQVVLEDDYVPPETEDRKRILRLWTAIEDARTHLQYAIHCLPEKP